MKLNKIWVVIVMFAVLAVPAFAVIDYNTDVSHAILVDYTDSTSAITDPTGNGFDGSLSGATINTAGGYMDCDGTNDRMTVNYPANLTGDWSTSIAVYVDTKAGDKAFVGKYNAGSDRYYSFMSNTNWNFRTCIDSTCMKDTNANSAGQWYIYTLIHNSTDGTTKQYQGTTLVNTGPSFTIANNYQWEFCKITPIHGYLDGRITQWYMFNRALDATELAAHYASVDADKKFMPFTDPNTKFNITAYDAETAQPILTFNTTLNGTVLSTTNGTITYNETGFYNTVVNATGYQTVTTSKTYVAGTTTQWNLTAINRTATFKAFSNFSAPINTFNITTGAGATYTTTNGTIFASLDRTVLHNLSFNAINYYPNVLTNFNVSNDFNATLVTVLKNVTFTATNFSGSAINNVNVTVDGSTHEFNNSKTLELDTRNIYNITFDKANFFDDVQTNVNITSDVVGNLTEHFRIVVGSFTPASGGTGTVVNGVNYSEVEYSALIDFTDSSTALTDPSGSDFELSLTGATIDTTSGYMLCDGTNDYAESNLAVNLTAPYTLSIKMNQHVKEADHGIISKYVSGTDRWYLFSSNNFWQARVLGTNGAGGSFDVKVPSSAPYLAANADITYVVVNDGSRTAVYLNGTLKANNSNTADVSNDKPLRFCNNDVIHTGNYFDGNLSQFYVFNTALTQAEVVGHTQNVENDNKFNPFTPGSGSETVNATDQYTVSWNSSTYYPNSENKTYLPVRFTLENFTVNPTTLALKQASFINYDTTNHLTFTLNNSHQVTAKNLFDLSNILNFTVNVSGSLYTANGSIAYLQNESGIKNYSVTHPSYFTVFAENVNVTNGSSNVTMHQAELRFNGTQRFTNNTVSEGNVTIGATKKAFGETFYLNAGTYTAVYSSVHDEAKEQNFTIGVRQNLSETITNITNANLTITGINAVDGTPIPFFSTTVVNNTLFINLSKTEASPHLYNLLQNTSLNVTFDNTSYALNDTLIVLDNRSTSYTFYVHTTNSFNISILNELTKDEITDTNFTVEFIGSYESYNYTYEDGNLYADLIVPDQYQIRYNWINTTSATDYGQLRQYHFILTNRTHNPLDLYAINESISTPIEISVQNGNTLLRQEGVIVKLQRFYIDTNSYETVAMYETDSQGKAYFDVEADDELYKFVVDSPLGTTVYTSTPQYIKETEYTIFIDLSQDPIATYQNNAGLTVTVSYDSTGATATYNDPQVTAGEYEFRVYERGPYVNTLVSTATGTTASGSLVNTYAFDNTSSYYGVFYRDSVAEASFDFVDFLETNGLPALGLFLTSILFVVAVFISAFSLYSVIIASMALVAANMIGLITISTPIIGAVVVGAIILAIILEWRRG
tara:strand:- start:863 stop:4930 length:4068 start_codon:yes stop_codon:yes gene_type:complete